MQPSLGYYHMCLSTHVYGTCVCVCVPLCACESQGTASVLLSWVGLNTDHPICPDSTFFLLAEPSHWPSLLHFSSSSGNSSYPVTQTRSWAARDSSCLGRCLTHQPMSISSQYLHTQSTFLYTSCPHLGSTVNFPLK